MTHTKFRPLTQSEVSTLPGNYSWEEFQDRQVAMRHSGLQLTYLDGVIERKTKGEDTEYIKSLIGLFLGLHFWQKGIEFEPVGSATRASKEKSVSFEPDESYYLGEQRDHLDLAIEVNITSGSPAKLEKYKRFAIQEVWMWQDDELALYSLESGEYQQMTQSKLLPELNIALFTECVLIPSRLQAIQKFTN